MRNSLKNTRYPEEPRELSVLLICGSTRSPSYTRIGLKEIEGLLNKKEGVKTHFWDLRDEMLPIADPKFHRTPLDHPDERVKRLVRLANEADAFVLGTPVYHNSYSGVLKNALDHLTIQQFIGKSVGLVAHGDERTVIQACDHLRIVVRGLSAVAIPIQVATVNTDFEEIDGDYRLNNEEIEHRMSLMVDQLLFFTTRLSAKTEE